MLGEQTTAVGQLAAQVVQLQAQIQSLTSNASGRGDHEHHHGAAHHDADLPKHGAQGITAEPRLWFQNATNRDHVLQRFLASQNPPDCSTAHYLVIDDFNAQSGMGFTFLVLQSYLQQALQERRVLVFASALIPNATWRWCAEGPQDFSCYFEPWSRCERWLIGRRSELGARALPQWEADHSSDAPIVHLAQQHDRSRHAEATLYRKWDAGCCSREWAGWSYTAPVMGKSWWLGIAWQVLLRTRPFMQRAALDFLEAQGVRPSEPFVVAVVRHGGKHVEEKEVAVSEYEQPLAHLMGAECLRTRHVLLITETAGVVRDFTEMCRGRGWNCFASAQARTDLEYDPWNPKNSKERNPKARGEAADSAMMHHIGWHSLLNLEASKRGAALVGSIQSQWVLMTLAQMSNFQRRPISMCSLRKGWRTANFYPPRYEGFLSDATLGRPCQTHPPNCTDLSVPLRYAW